MTVMKERAVEMIQRMPEDNMLYVINILKNLEAMSLNKEKDKERAQKALGNILNMDKRLPEDFDCKKELQERKNMVILVDTNIIIDVKNSKVKAIEPMEFVKLI